MLHGPSYVCGAVLLFMLCSCITNSMVIRSSETLVFDNIEICDMVFGDLVFGDMIFGDIVFGDIIFNDTVFGDMHGIPSDIVFGDMIFGVMLYSDFVLGDMVSGELVFSDMVFGNMTVGDKCTCHSLYSLYPSSK